MSHRVQLDCLKQGSIDSHNWSVRTLTIDRHTGTLIISRRGRPEVTFYHALRPSVVQRWPHFCADATPDDFHSVEAKRTLCISGVTAAVPDFAEEEVALVGIPLPLTNIEATTAMTEAQQQRETVSYASAGASRSGKRRRCTPGSYDAWMLQFPSKVLYDVAVQILMEMPRVRFQESVNEHHFCMKVPRYQVFSTMSLSVLPPSANMSSVQRKATARSH